MQSLPVNGRVRQADGQHKPQATEQEAAEDVAWPVFTEVQARRPLATGDTFEGRGTCAIRSRGSALGFDTWYADQPTDGEGLRFTSPSGCSLEDAGARIRARGARERGRQAPRVLTWRCWWNHPSGIARGCSPRSRSLLRPGASGSWIGMSRCSVAFRCTWSISLPSRVGPDGARPGTVQRVLAGGR